MAEELGQSLMPISEKALHEIFKMYNLTPEQVKRTREAVLEYCSKQEHLKHVVQYLDKTYVIERLLQVSKGSTELCKQKLELTLTARSFLPELLLNRNMEEFEDLLEIVNICLLPKSTPVELCTVVVSQLQTSNIEKFSLLSYLRYLFLLVDYTISYRYGGAYAACRLVFNMKECPMSLITKVDPNIMRKVQVLNTKYYKIKVKGIHILNATPFVDKLIALFKIVLTPKLTSRIYVHGSYEDFYKYIPKEVLPKDFGGYEDSCREITGRWKALFESEEGQQNIQCMEKLVSDESKREKPLSDQEHLGISGTFKSLEVD